MWVVLNWLVLFIATLSPVESGLVLNEFITHFEPLYYDHKHLQYQHHRIRRSTKDQLTLEFSAHSRVFRLRLHTDTFLFSEDVVIEATTGPLAFDVTRVYMGQLEGDEESAVSGLITAEGLFDGTIFTSHDEEFFIEPSNHYFATSTDFHSIIYKASDVHFTTSNNSCASDELHRRQPHWRRRQSWPQLTGNRTKRRAPYREWQSAWTEESKKRMRKSTLDPRKTTCMLYLQADHLFYLKMGTEEACIETMTRHVQRVNSIYKVTDFDQDGQPDNISFMIKRIKVHTPEALKDPKYRFPGNYGVEKFLELFSEEDYNAFCLAYMFTYRDFEGGTLGLAWTGDLKNAGGVCEKNGHYRGSQKSLNTGIVTLLNYGKHVPPAVSHVTLAHEIGHNFGSPHDPEDDRTCTPGGEDGNYIMFARATSGDKRNNNKFSPCSLKSINAVLNTKARDSKGCFTEPQDSICGNEVVEKGEECDCGWTDDCQESCCWPMNAHPAPGETPCRLRPNRTCSPSQGPCCTGDCELKDGTKCRDDNGCRDASFCEKSNGATCPPSNNKPNKTICNEEFVCYMGECTGSICIAYGLESCQCKRGPTEPVTKACELCCKRPGDEPCISSFEWNTPPYDVPDMYAKPGTPCDNYNGYCDVFQKCREVDPSGPLATLRKLLLSTESIASLKRWILDHWWGVLLISIGFIIVLAAVVKLFGKPPETKSKVTMNGPSYHSTSNHAITTAISRTNLPLHTTTAAAYANGQPPGNSNGWV